MAAYGLGIIIRDFSLFGWIVFFLGMWLFARDADTGLPSSHDKSIDERLADHHREEIRQALRSKKSELTHNEQAHKRNDASQQPRTAPRSSDAEQYEVVEKEPDPNALPQQTHLKEYEIIRQLGAGSFGITYLAFDHNLNGPVALKEYFYAALSIRRSDSTVAPVSTQHTDDYEWGRARFVEEARILSNLNHPNIVRVRRFFEANNTAYIVMDYVDGEPLSRFLDRHGELTPTEWHRWLDALLDGLEHVHGADYLHRDIKPHNIMIRAATIESEQPVLIDFGAARRAAADQTQTLTAVHTPRYAPIEQYSSTGRQAPSADIYSLAAVSYRALAGELPPDAADRVVHDEYQSLAELLGDPDDPLLTAIDSALAVRATDRPQSVDEWRDLMQTPVTIRSVADRSLAQFGLAEHTKPFDEVRREVTEQFDAVYHREIERNRKMRNEKYHGISRHYQWELEHHSGLHAALLKEIRILESKKNRSEKDAERARKLLSIVKAFTIPLDREFRADLLREIEILDSIENRSVKAAAQLDWLIRLGEMYLASDAEFKAVLLDEIETLTFIHDRSKKDTLQLDWLIRLGEIYFGTDSKFKAALLHEITTLESIDHPSKDDANRLNWLKGRVLLSDDKLN